MNYLTTGQMNLAILTTTTGAFATLLVTLVGHFLSRIHETRVEELKIKLERYQELLTSFTQLGRVNEAQLKFANSMNAMNLMASKPVLDSIYTLVDYIQTHSDKPSYSVGEQDRIVSKIILAMRREIGTGTKSFGSFGFRVISGPR